MTGCPSWKELQTLLRNESSEADASIAAHLDVCEPCSRAWEEMAGSLLAVSGLKVVVSPPEYEFLNRLKEQCPEELLRVDSAAENHFPLHFPGPPTIFGQLGQLEHFHIREFLGEGAYGLVYRAWDEKLDRDVAIKVLKPALCAVESVRSSFDGEARAVAQVDHPHVVKVHEIRTLPSFPPYIVMEYVDGESVRQLLERDKSLEPKKAAALARQVALGLAAVHAHKLIHRDVKPSNLLLKKSPATEGQITLVITDLGLARALDKEERGLRVPRTLTGELAGTPAYMSPEQITGSKTIDARSDLFGLGAVLYQTLTGTLPFKGANDLDTLRLIKSAEPKPPHLLNATVPRDLETICLKCLEKDPEKRYVSAKETADDLARYLDGMAIHARPVGQIEKLWRWSWRHRAVAAMTLFAAALLLTWIVGGPIVAVREARLRSRAEERFTQVRGLAKTFIFDMHDAIRDLPGSTSPRHLLVKTGLVYLDALKRDAGDDIALLREIRLGYNRLGDVQGNSIAHLGELHGARESYKEGLKIAQHVLHLCDDLSRKDPDWLQAQDDVAVSLALVGDIYRNLGDPQQALNYHTEACELLAAQAADFPDHIEAQRQYSVSLNRVGRLHLELRRPDEAGKCFQEALKIARDAASKMPDDMQLQSDICAGLLQLGDLADYALQPATALEHYLDAETAAKGMAAKANDDPHVKRLLGMANERVGNAFGALGRTQEALDRHLATLTLRESVANADRMNVEAWFDLAVAHERCADFYLELANRDKALAHINETIHIREDLLSRTKRLDIRMLRALVESYRKMGGVHASLASVQEQSNENRMRLVMDAVMWYKKAYSILKELKERAALPNEDEPMLNRMLLMEPKCYALLEAPQLHLALERAARGEHLASYKVVEELSEAALQNADVCYIAACVCSLAASASSDALGANELERNQIKEKYMHRARHLLMDAAKRGFFKSPERWNQIADEPFLSGFRRYDNYSSFVNELQMTTEEKMQ